MSTQQPTVINFSQDEVELMLDSIKYYISAQRKRVVELQADPNSGAYTDIVQAHIQNIIDADKLRTKINASNNNPSVQC